MAVEGNGRTDGLQKKGEVDMKRRVIWAVAAMAVVTSMLSLYIAAEDTPAEPAIVIQSSGIAESNGDKMVTVTVSIRDNPGFVTATIPVEWNPEHLELVKVQNEDACFSCEPERVYSNGDWKDGWHGMPLADSHNEDGLYHLAWGSDASFEGSSFNFKEDGVLATLTFKVIADDAVKSTSVWTVEDSPIANLMNWDMEEQWQELSFENVDISLEKPKINLNVIGEGKNTPVCSVNSSTVTVECELPCKLGYKNSDGVYVSISATLNADGSYSYQIPTGVTEVVVGVSGDTNGDGEITLADSTRAKAFYNNKVDLGAERIFVADVNNDGKLTLADSTKIKAVYNNKVELSW